MLNRNDSAVTRDEFLVLEEGEIGVVTECDDGGFRRSSSFGMAERTSEQESDKVSAG